MSIRSTARDAAARAFHGLSRGTLKKVDDSTKMQELTIDIMYGETKTHVEHWHPYGWSTYPKVGQSQGGQGGGGDGGGGGGGQGGSQQQGSTWAEVLVGFLGGNRDHAVVLGTADRRYRLRGLKEGEVALHDDQGHQVHITRNGIIVSAPKGKKIVTQIMQKTDPPQADQSSQSSGQSYGGQASPQSQPYQGPQADSKKNKPLATFALDENSMTVMHPKEIKHQISDADGGNVKAHITMNEQSITRTHKTGSITDNAKTTYDQYSQMSTQHGPSQGWTGPLGAPPSGGGSPSVLEQRIVELERRLAALEARGST